MRVIKLTAWLVASQSKLAKRESRRLPWKGGDQRFHLLEMGVHRRGPQLGESLKFLLTAQGVDALRELLRHFRVECALQPRLIGFAGAVYDAKWSINRSE